MRVKNQLRRRIRSWLPKEPDSSRVLLKIKEFRIKIRHRKPPTERERVIGGLGGGGGALVLLGLMNYFLLPWYPMSFIIAEEAVGWSLVSLAFLIWVTDEKRKISAKKSSPKNLTNGTPNLIVPQMASHEKAPAFVTREANWWVMTPGALSLLNFFIILYSVLLFGQSSTALFLLVFFGSLAFLMLVLHPAATKIKVTKDRIDWKTLGIGTSIQYDDLKEIRVRRFCLKLDMGTWRTMCPVNRNGFLTAVREAKPDLPITGWKH